MKPSLRFAAVRSACLVNPADQPPEEINNAKQEIAVQQQISNTHNLYLRGILGMHLICLKA